MTNTSSAGLSLEVADAASVNDIACRIQTLCQRAHALTVAIEQEVSCPFDDVDLGAITRVDAFNSLLGDEIEKLRRMALQIEVFEMASTSKGGA